MKTANSFEIHVAVIGFVSVGKTTLINALLKDKYGEVSMKRTTAGVNRFRITTTEPDGGTLSSREYQSVQSTLEEISDDNKQLRNADTVQEKTFDVTLDEPLVEMRDNTTLVLVDIPGINEAGASKKYKDYVNENWHSFDCAIVMLDGRQGVNTEEQMELLRQVKANNENAKRVSTIIVMNKIDDHDDEEQQVLVKEAKQEVQKIFGVSDLDKALKSTLSNVVNNPLARSFQSPLLLPMSAVHAFIYRSASTMNFDLFKKKINQELIEKLGRECYGRPWKRLKREEKQKKAYDVIRDPEQFEDGIKASQFDKFLSALSFFLGGSSTQSWLVEEQIRVSELRLVPELDFVKELWSLHDKSLLLGRPVDFVHSRFKDLHNQSVAAAVAKFTEAPTEVHCLAKPMEEIYSYLRLLQGIGLLEAKKEELIQYGKSLVRELLQTVTSPSPWPYAKLNNFDKMFIFWSVLSVSKGSFFSEHFGIAGMALEHLCQEANPRNIPTTNIPCSSTYCQQKLARKSWNETRIECSRCHHSTRVPIDQAKLEEAQKLQQSFQNNHLRFDLDFLTACSPTKPEHFGHIIWKFEHLLMAVEEASCAPKLKDTEAA